MVSPAVRQVLLTPWLPNRLIGNGLAGWWSAKRSPITIDNTPYAGTGVLAQTGTTITGVGSKFLSEVKVGDLIAAAGLTSDIVVTVTDDTHLTMTQSTNSGAGLTYTVNPVAGVTDRVSQWNDISGNGTHLLSATATTRPALMPNQINGNRAMVGDGAGDVFTVSLPSNMQVNNSLLAVVMNPLDVTTGGLVVQRGTAAGGHTTNGITNAAKLQAVSDSTTKTDVITGSTSLVVGTPVIAMHQRTTAALSLYRNGSSDATDVATQEPNALYGAGAVLNVFTRDTGLSSLANRIGEIIIVNRAPTAAELKSLNRYLSREWAIPVAA